MIATPDAGEIKAKVTIEYDGGGVDKAKEDLQSLSDIVGGELADNIGGANEALSGLDEQMGKNAESAGSFVDSLGGIEKPLERGSDAVAMMTDTLGEHQSAIEEASSAYEDLQKPIEEATASMQNVVAPMGDITENAHSMQEQLGTINESFTNMGDTLAQSTPLLPQFADGMRSVNQQFAVPPVSAYEENLAVFQDALVNPEPFSLIQQHLDETGQTWGNFIDDVGNGNTEFLNQMAANALASDKSFGAMSSGVENVGQSFYQVTDQTEAFNQQWGDMAFALDGINKNGGIGTTLYGPDESWAKLNTALANTEEGMNKIGGVGNIPYGPPLEGMNLFGGVGEGLYGPEDFMAKQAVDFSGLGTGFNNIVQGFDSFMRPIMYAQMAGMMISQLGQGIYNMAALAEGPAAHSVGTFTGAIDVMGKHAQQAGEQFSEGFGQGVMPMLDAMNNVSSSNGGSDIWGNIGHVIGSGLSLVGNLGQIIAGGIVDLGSLGFTLNPSNPVGNSWMQSGWEGLQNIWAGVTGQPEPYPTPGGSSSSNVTIDIPAIQASITQSIAVMNAQANNPGYLAAQAYLQSQAADASRGQAAYDISHTSGKTPFDYTPQAYQNQMIQAALHGGPTDGIDMVALDNAWLNSFGWNPGGSGGCFPSGTPVLLSNGTTKAIETLCIGDRVLAHDGTKHVSTTVLALLKPPPRLVFDLVFDTGKTLTLTDSHPIMTNQGWKSLSPDNTKKENPDLLVRRLLTGDCIMTVDGSCTLLAIEPREIVPIYNITVGNPHTFYANGVLVHNKAKAMGSQIMQNVANSDVPDTNLKNSNLIQSMMSNFSGVDLSHTFTASVSWEANNLEKQFTGTASWVGQGLSQGFTAIASWVGQGLSQGFTAIASWVGQGLSQGFTAVANWIGQGLSQAFTAVANWLSQGLTNTFTGVADWIGQNLEHTFTAVANWVTQEVTQVTSSIPGFASGVEGFQGGLAIVGEHGPELVYLPGGSSVYPQSSGSGGFQPINMPGDNSGHVAVTLNHTTTLNGRVVAQETIPYIAPILRTYMGVRQ